MSDILKRLEMAVAKNNTAAIINLVKGELMDAAGKTVIETPCEVGADAYIISSNCKDNHEKDQMCFCWGKSCKTCEKSYPDIFKVKYPTESIREIIGNMGLCGEKGGFGKTVFLTEQAATNALERGKGNE